MLKTQNQQVENKITTTNSNTTTTNTTTNFNNNLNNISANNLNFFNSNLEEEKLTQQIRQYPLTINELIKKEKHEEAASILDSFLNRLIRYSHLITSQEIKEALQQVIIITTQKISFSANNKSECNIKLENDVLITCVERCEKAFKLAEKYESKEQTIQLLILLSDFFYTQDTALDKAFTYRLWAYQRIKELLSKDKKWQEEQEKNIQRLNLIEQKQFAVIMGTWWILIVNKISNKLNALNKPTATDAVQFLMDLIQQATAQQVCNDAFWDVALEQLLPEIGNISTSLLERAIALIDAGIITSENFNAFKERMEECITIRTLWRPYQHINKIKILLDNWDKRLEKTIENKRIKFVDKQGWVELENKLSGYDNEKYKLKINSCKSLWQENYEKFNEIRSTVKKEFATQQLKIEEKIKQWQFLTQKEQEELLTKIREHQKLTTKKLITFLQDIFLTYCKILGKVDCKYAWLFCGSFARHEVTMYSDIESFMLLEHTGSELGTDEKEYFKVLMKNFRNAIGNLGETKLLDMISTKGFCLDGGIDITEDDRVLTTPQNLVNNIFNSSKFGVVDGISSSLLRPILIIGDQSLFTEYQNSLTSFASLLKQPISLAIKKTLFAITYNAEGHLEMLNKLVVEKLTDKTCIDIKKDYLAPLQYMLYDLSLLYGVELTKNQTYDVVDDLVSKKKFTQEFSAQFKKYYAFLCYLREKCYHYYHVENSVVNLPKFLLDNGNSTSSTLLPPASSTLPLVNAEFELIKELEEQFLPKFYSLFTKSFAPLWEEIFPSIVLNNEILNSNGVPDKESHNTLAILIVQIKNILIQLQFSVISLPKKNELTQNLWKSVIITCGILSLKPFPEALSGYQKIYKTFIQELKIPFVTIEKDFLQNFLNRIALVENDANRRRYIIYNIIQYPYRNGQRYSSQQKEIDWQQQLEELVTKDIDQQLISEKEIKINKIQPKEIPIKEIKTKEIEIEKNEIKKIEIKKKQQNNLPNIFLEGIDKKKIKLKEKFVQEIWDEKTNCFKESVYQEGNHLVYELSNNVFIKFYPEFAAVEQALYQLSELLFGSGITPSRLLKMTIAINSSQPPIIIPIVASRKVPGKKFGEILANKNDYQKIDRNQLYKMILFSMLTNPEDGKSNNYAVIILANDQGEEYYEVIGFDNERAFSAPFILKREKLIFKGLHLAVKNIFFCLDEMILPIPKEVIEEFLAIDPHLLCNEWIAILMQQENITQKLFPEKTWEIAVAVQFEKFLMHLAPKNWKEKFLLKKEKMRIVLILPRPPTFIKKLYQKINRMQKTFQEEMELHQKDDEREIIDPLDLLLRIEPELVKGREWIPGYGSLFINGINGEKQSKSPLEKFQQIPGKEYIGNQSSMCSLEHIQAIIEEVPKEEDLYNFSKYGCQLLFKELQKIFIEEQRIQIVFKKLIQSQEKNIKFLDESELWDENYTDTFIPQILKNLNFSLYSLQEQHLIIDKLKESGVNKKNPSNYRELTFINCEVLTQDELRKLLRNNSSIEMLTISNHLNQIKNVISNQQNFDDSLFKIILDNTLGLRRLSLDNITNLQNIQQKNIWGENAFVYQKLETLELTNLEQLNIIRLKAFKLRNLTIKNCALLTAIEFNAPKLKYLTIINCTVLTTITINSEKIQQVNLLGCANFLVERIRDIIENAPHLKLISLDDKKAEMVVQKAVQSIFELKKLEGKYNQKNSSSPPLLINLLTKSLNFLVKISKVLPTSQTHIIIDELYKLIADNDDEICHMAANVLTEIAQTLAANQEKLQKLTTKLIEMLQDIDKLQNKNEGKNEDKNKNNNKNKNDKIRTHILSLLCKIDGIYKIFSVSQIKLIVEDLCELLSDNSKDIHIAAGIALINIYKMASYDQEKLEMIINGLIATLQDENKSNTTRIRVVKTLTQIDATYKIFSVSQMKLIVNALCDLLNHYSENIQNARKNALLNICKMVSSNQEKLEVVIKELIEVVQNKNTYYETRICAIEVLTKIDETYKIFSTNQMKLIVNALCELLNEYSDDIQNAGKNALLNIVKIVSSDQEKLEVVIKELIEVVQNKNTYYETRICAIEVLTKIDETYKIFSTNQMKLIVNALCELLNDYSDDIQNAGKNALLNICKMVNSDPEKLEVVIKELIEVVQNKNTYYETRICAIEVLTKIDETYKIFSTNQMKLIVNALCELLNEYNCYSYYNNYTQNAGENALLNVGKAVSSTQEKLEVVIKELIEVVQNKDKSDETQIRALEILTKIDETYKIFSTNQIKFIVNTLCELLSEENNDLQNAVGNALLNIAKAVSSVQEKLEVVIKELIEVVQNKDKSDKTRIRALEVLTKIDETYKIFPTNQMKLIVNTLCELLSEENNDLQNAGKNALLNICKMVSSDKEKLEVVIEELIEVVQNKDKSKSKTTRIRALEVLTKIDETYKIFPTNQMKLIINILCKSLSDEDNDLQNARKNTLLNIAKAVSSNQEKLEVVINELIDVAQNKDKSKTTRICAIEVLTKIDETYKIFSTHQMKLIVNALCELLSEEDNDLQNAGKNALLNICKMVSSDKEKLEVVIEELIEVVQNKDKSKSKTTRIRALEVLTKIDETYKIFPTNQMKLIVNALCGLLNDYGKDIQNAGVNALLNVGKAVSSDKEKLKVVIKELIEVVQNKNTYYETRIRALEVLTKIDETYKFFSANQIKVIVNALCELLSEYNCYSYYNDYTQNAGVNALLNVGKAVSSDKEKLGVVINELIKVVQNKSDKTRIHVLEVLTKIDDTYKIFPTNQMKLIVNALCGLLSEYNCYSYYNDYTQNAGKNALLNICKMVSSDKEKLEVVIEELIEVVQNKNKGNKTRIRVLEVLTKIDETYKIFPTNQMKLIVNALCGLLNDYGKDIQNAGENALLNVGKAVSSAQEKLEVVIKELIEVVQNKDKSDKTRIRALEVLTKIDETYKIFPTNQIKLIINILCKSLSDEDNDLQNARKNTLLNIAKAVSSAQEKLEVVIKELIEVVQNKDKSDKTRIRALEVLTKIDEAYKIFSASQMKLIVNTLCELLSEENNDLQNAGKNALLNICKMVSSDKEKLEVVIEELIEVVQNKDKSKSKTTRIRALEVLTKIDEAYKIFSASQMKLIVNTLCELLSEENNDLQNAGKNALLNICKMVSSDKEKLEVVIEELIEVVQNKDKSDKTRIRALEVLTKIDETYKIFPTNQIKLIINILCKSLSDEDNDLQNARKNTLLNIAKAVSSNQEKLAIVINELIDALQDKDKSDKEKNRIFAALNEAMIYKDLLLHQLEIIVEECLKAFARNYFNQAIKVLKGIITAFDENTTKQIPLINKLLKILQDNKETIKVKFCIIHVLKNLNALVLANNQEIELDNSILQLIKEPQIKEKLLELLPHNKDYDDNFYNDCDYKDTKNLLKDALVYIGINFAYEQDEVIKLVIWLTSIVDNKNLNTSEFAMHVLKELLLGLEKNKIFSALLEKVEPITDKLFEILNNKNSDLNIDTATEEMLIIIMKAIISAPNKIKNSTIKSKFIKLSKKLTDERPKTSMKMLWQLSQLSPPNNLKLIIEALYKNLGDNNESISDLSWLILIYIGKSLSASFNDITFFINHLQELIKTENSIDCFQFVITKITAKFANSDCKVREAAKNMLVKIGNLAYSAPDKITIINKNLINILLNKNIDIQIWAVYTLGEFKKINQIISFEQVELIFNALNKTTENGGDELAIIAVLALICLDKFKIETAKEFIKTLCDALKDENITAVECAAYVLIELIKNEKNISYQEKLLIVENLSIKLTSNHINTSQMAKKLLINTAINICSNPNEANIFIKKLFCKQNNKNVFNRTMFVLEELIKDGKVMTNEQVQCVMEHLYNMFETLQVPSPQKEVVKLIQKIGKTDMLKWNKIISKLTKKRGFIGQYDKLIGEFYYNSKMGIANLPFFYEALDYAKIVRRKQRIKHALISIGLSTSLYQKQMQFFIDKLIKIFANNSKEIIEELDNEYKIKIFITQLINILQDKEKETSIKIRAAFIIGEIGKLLKIISLDTITAIMEHLLKLSACDNYENKQIVEKTMVRIGEVACLEEDRISKIVIQLIEPLKSEKKVSAICVSCIYVLGELIASEEMSLAQMKTMVEQLFNLFETDNEDIKCAVDNALVSIAKTNFSDKNKIILLVTIAIKILLNKNCGIDLHVVAAYLFKELVKFENVIPYYQITPIIKQLFVLFNNDDNSIKQVAESALLAIAKVMTFAQEEMKNLVTMLICALDNGKVNVIIRTLYLLGELIALEKISYDQMQIIVKKISKLQKNNDNNICINDAACYFSIKMDEAITLAQNKIKTFAAGITKILHGNNNDVNFWKYASHIFSGLGKTINIVSPNQICFIIKQMLCLLDKDAENIYWSKFPKNNKWLINIDYDSFDPFHDLFAISYPFEPELLYMKHMQSTYWYWHFSEERFEEHLRDNKGYNCHPQVKRLLEHDYWRIRYAVENMLIEIGETITSDPEKKKVFATELIAAFKDERKSIEFKTSVIYVLADMEKSNKVISFEQREVIAKQLFNLFEKDDANLRNAAENLLFAIMSSIDAEQGKIATLTQELLNILENKEKSTDAKISSVNVLYRLLGKRNKIKNIMPFGQMQSLIEQLVKLFDTKNEGLKDAAKSLLIKIKQISALLKRLCKIPPSSQPETAIKKRIELVKNFKDVYSIRDEHADEDEVKDSKEKIIEKTADQKIEQEITEYKYKNANSKNFSPQSIEHNIKLLITAFKNDSENKAIEQKIDELIAELEVNSNEHQSEIIFFETESSMVDQNNFKEKIGTINEEKPKEENKFISINSSPTNAPISQKLASTSLTHLSFFSTNTNNSINNTKPEEEKIDLSSLSLNALKLISSNSLQLNSSSQLPNEPTTTSTSTNAPKPSSFALISSALITSSNLPNSSASTPSNSSTLSISCFTQLTHEQLERNIELSKKEMIEKENKKNSSQKETQNEEQEGEFFIEEDNCEENNCNEETNETEETENENTENTAKEMPEKNNDKKI